MMRRLVIRWSLSSRTLVLAIGFLHSFIGDGWCQNKVTLERNDGQFRLLRNEEPYFIRGVGGDSYLSLLAQSGGNSIRTWGVDDLDRVLPEAEKHGLTVCVGIWLGHARHGFDYGDQQQVDAQYQQAIAAVEKYKDHPAVLLWGIGNEMEGDGKDPLVYQAVNRIARRVKEIDPNHPTMTVIAEVGEAAHKVRSIERWCPDIDIIGINSYGGITTLGQRYRGASGSKPYIVTEHGPLGPWEVGKTSWGAAVERNSTVKATFYRDGYRAAVQENADLCLGAYTFLWGHKQETTATWFGMLLPDEARTGTVDRTGAVDEIAKMWTGDYPENRCPRVESFQLNGPPKGKPGTQMIATVRFSDPEEDAVKIEWVLRGDSVFIGAGGDAERSEASIENAVLSVQRDGDQERATIQLPEAAGKFRLFAYLRDGHGGAAVANAPLYGDSSKPSKATVAELPFVIYGDESPQSIFVPAGYMGNAAAIQMEPTIKAVARSGKWCLQVDYKSTDAWGGVLWQSPAGDWEGKKPGGLDFTGASHLEFWVRGAQGGEVVNFVFGVVDGEFPYRDTAKGELAGVKLTNEWQRMRIPLAGKDLGRIKTGFGWSLAGQGAPVTFYLDDIRYVKLSETDAE